MICPICGCDTKVWLEVFGEEHYCFDADNNKITMGEQAP